jgi:hypothetical protein
MLNQLILTGNLGNDPEAFFGSEGDPVSSFSLAYKKHIPFPDPRSAVLGRASDCSKFFV